MIVQMPISCDMEDRKYFESVCKKRSLTKRQFIKELVELHKNVNNLSNNKELNKKIKNN